MPAICRHCHLEPGARRRGLCYACYANRDIRRLYAPATRNRPDQSCRARRLPAKPTAALPGSEAKLRVFEQRFARREALFHPLDA